MTKLASRMSYPAVSKDGMATFSSELATVISHKEHTTIYKIQGHDAEYNLYEELRRCCLFSTAGILYAFSIGSAHLQITLQVGIIYPITIQELFKGKFKDEEIILLAARLPAAVTGDAIKGEGIFPHAQYLSEAQVNVCAASFPQCPREFAAITPIDLYFTLKQEDPAVDILQSSLRELGNGNYMISIVLLYSALEMACDIAGLPEAGKVGHRLNLHAKRIMDVDGKLSKKLRRIKKDIEEHLVKQRGLVAHQGKQVNPFELNKAYAAAFDFFWIYDRIKLSTKKGAGISV